LDSTFAEDAGSEVSQSILQAKVDFNDIHALANGV
jgi:hypothetical protein